MPAGSIAVPTIVPLRAPIAGKLKNIIDTCTPIEVATGNINKTIQIDNFNKLSFLNSSIRDTKCRDLLHNRRLQARSICCSWR
jgi:hypothetical protein